MWFVLISGQSGKQLISRPSPGWGLGSPGNTPRLKSHKWQNSNLKADLWPSPVQSTVDAHNLPSNREQLSRKQLWEEGPRGKLLRALEQGGEDRSTHRRVHVIWRLFSSNRQRCVHTQACLSNIHSSYLGTTDTPADCGHGGGGTLGKLPQLQCPAGTGGRKGHQEDTAALPLAMPRRVKQGRRTELLTCLGGGATRYSRNPRRHLTQISGLGRRQ